MKTLATSLPLLSTYRIYQLVKTTTHPITLFLRDSAATLSLHCRLGIGSADITHRSFCLKAKDKPKAQKRHSNILKIGGDQKPALPAKLFNSWRFWVFWFVKAFSVFGESRKRRAVRF
jgi:hypothetical protein